MLQGLGQEIVLGGTWAKGIGMYWDVRFFAAGGGCFDWDAMVYQRTQFLLNPKPLANPKPETPNLKRCLMEFQHSAS